ncbi:MAG: polysaccharide deacetylase family protein [Phycisphaerae bacterium]|nr:polysaccharide deacetylase family protein [Phycisphaerae bacterium]
MSILDKVITHSVNRIAALTGRAEARFADQIDAAHVLCYHTIVPNDLAKRGWVASHAVTVSQFESQMAMLAQTGRVRRLSEISRCLQCDEMNDGPHVAITFDDGLADNVLLALPILQRYGLPASFFLSTGVMDRGDLFVGDKIRILRDAKARGRLRMTIHPVCERLLEQPGYYKIVAVSDYREALDELWAVARHRVDPAAVEACRVMRWDEARLLRDAGMEIGAHTVNHVILSRESSDVRQFEIVESIRRVGSEMRRTGVPFAYPNGQSADFDESDSAVLRELKTPYAVTTIPGANRAGTDPMTLRRHCIGIRHTAVDLWTAFDGDHAAVRVRETVSGCL